MKDKKIFFIFGFLFFISYFLFVTCVYAEVIERIVAIVDDDVITLSEFKEAFQNALSSGVKPTEILKDEVLTGMINKILLLREAKRLRMEHLVGKEEQKNDNALLRKYIEKRIKAFIRISFDSIEKFYNINKKSFGDKKFYDVKNEIESYLIEKELNKKLLEHIKELRENAYIRIQL